MNKIIATIDKAAWAVDASIRTKVNALASWRLALIKAHRHNARHRAGHIYMSNWQVSIAG